MTRDAALAVLRRFMRDGRVSTAQAREALMVVMPELVPPPLAPDAPTGGISHSG